MAVCATFFNILSRTEEISEYTDTNNSNEKVGLCRSITPSIVVGDRPTYGVSPELTFRGVA